MPGKQYEVIRDFRLTDRKTGKDSHHKVGDTYDGPLDNEYLLDDNGPDGKGPLIIGKAEKAAEEKAAEEKAAEEKAAEEKSDEGNAEKTAASSEKTSPSASSASSNKEK